MNMIKTVLLMFGLIALFMFIGNAIAGQQGMIYAFILALVMNFASYWFSDKIVLMMYGAKPIKKEDAPKLYEIVKKLTINAKLPMPKLYVVESQNPNAFATGRSPSHAAVAVTTGILNLLTDDELEGVLGHELSHIKNRDMLIGTMAATIAGAIFMLSRMAQFAAMFGGGGDSREGNRGNAVVLLATAIIAPIAALVIQMAISRSREYLADRSGARLTHKPMSLASALKKISAGVKQSPMNASPVTAHLFIMNPLSGRSLLTLFSTHPSVEDRVKKLQQFSYGGMR